MPAFSELLSNAKGAFLNGLGHSYIGRAAKQKGALTKTRSVAAALAHENKLTAFSPGFIGGVDAAMGAASGKGFIGRGMAGLKHGAKTLGTDSFAKGYLGRVGMGAGVGMAGGAGASYYNNDGVGGYAANMGMGAIAGAAGGHAYANARTAGTTLNTMGGRGGALASGWRALRGQ